MHYHSLVIRVTQVSVSGITKYLSRIRRRSTVAEGDSKAHVPLHFLLIIIIFCMLLKLLLDE